MRSVAAQRQPAQQRTTPTHQARDFLVNGDEPIAKARDPHVIGGQVHAPADALHQELWVRDGADAEAEGPWHGRARLASDDGRGLLNPRRVRPRELRVRQAMVQHRGREVRRMNVGVRRIDRRAGASHRSKGAVARLNEAVAKERDVDVQRGEVWRAVVVARDEELWRRRRLGRGAKGPRHCWAALEVACGYESRPRAAACALARASAPLLTVPNCSQADSGMLCGALCDG